MRLAGTLKKIEPQYPNWEPGVEMDQAEPGDRSRWRVQLEARDGTGIEYKYMAGPPWDWSHAEALKNGDARANRRYRFKSGGSSIQEDFVDAWL